MGEVFGLRDSFKGISEKLKSSDLLTRTWPDLEGISEDIEHTGFKVGGGTPKLESDETRNDRFEWIVLADLEL